MTSNQHPAVMSMLSTLKSRCVKPLIANRIRCHLHALFTARLRVLIRSAFFDLLCQEMARINCNQHRHNQSISPLSPTCKLSCRHCIEHCSITVRNIAIVTDVIVILSRHTIVAAHAAVQEAHDETSIHLRWQYSQMLCIGFVCNATV